jgi:halimadienyl-diphosphate synthase
MANLIDALIEQIGPGHMPSTAYDTAWAARLGAIDASLGNGALDWICSHQLSDGSWGAEFPFNYHDRVISTLAAMIALTYRGRRHRDQQQIALGLEALERIIGGATSGLQSDPNGATVGFEMIAPMLVAEAERLGIIKRQGERILGRLGQLRTKKLENIRGKLINRNLTIAFSAEMAGIDGQHMLDVDHLQEVNGSVGHSPSASAYFALYVKENEPATMEYLRRVVNFDGGMPNVAPFDVFEIGWALWNLSLLPNFKSFKNLGPHVEFLERAWEAKRGVGFAAEYSVKDSDDTGLVFDTLSRFGHEKDIESVLAYEEQTHFRCYALEANPSISANIHVLGALRQAGFDNQHPSVQKILKFLRQAKNNGPYWIDKWHSSPYYATTHAIMACAGFADDLVEDAVTWILSSQRSDGSWGITVPTVEETAYAIQALWVWNEKTASVPPNCLKIGAKWLESHFEDVYHPLWIGKCLYAPSLVIRSAAISALTLVE